MDKPRAILPASRRTGVLDGDTRIARFPAWQGRKRKVKSRLPGIFAMQLCVAKLLNGQSSSKRERQGFHGKSWYCLCYYRLRTIWIFEPLIFALKRLQGASDRTGAIASKKQALLAFRLLFWAFRGVRKGKGQER